MAIPSNQLLLLFMLNTKFYFIFSAVEILVLKLSIAGLHVVIEDMCKGNWFKRIAYFLSFFGFGSGVLFTIFYDAVWVNGPRIRMY